MDARRAGTPTSPTHHAPPSPPQWAKGITEKGGSRRKEARGAHAPRPGSSVKCVGVWAGQSFKGTMASLYPMEATWRMEIFQCPCDLSFSLSLPGRRDQIRKY